MVYDPPRHDPAVAAWKSGGFDWNRPSPTNKPSQYRMMLDEMERKSGIFNDKTWDGKTMEPEYCPPWRMTMTDLYGKEAVEKLRKPIDTYEERVRKIADEEAARRRGEFVPSPN